MKEKTVLITGASSGIGASTSLLFAQKGWHVIAGMRSPEKRTTPLHENKRIDVRELDLTSVKSVKILADYVTEHYGEGLEVIINNAGIGAFGPLEELPFEEIKRVFQVNILGMIELTQKFIPLFREKKDGVIVNVASVAGRAGLPLYSIYNSTKFAVEGFSEGLYYEMRPMGIRVRIVEPGTIKTDFFTRSLIKPPMNADSPYLDIRKCYEARYDTMRKYSTPGFAGKLIYKAATAKGWTLRYTGGAGAHFILTMRKLLPANIFPGTVFRLFGKGKKYCGTDEEKNI